MNAAATPLRRARQRAQISQQELQELSNVSQALISRLELGHCPQSVRAAIRIARALGTTVEQIFGDSAAAPSPGRGRRRVYKRDGGENANEAA